MVRGRRRNTMMNVKYNVNDTYFEKIDTAEKAYWLGFLYADGHNTESPHWRVSFILKKQDALHVEKFNKIFYPTGDKKITFRKADGAASSVIHSKKICEDLIRLNVVNRKSLIIKFPNLNIVPKEFILYFIQGLFDGDGSVSIFTKTKPACACLDFSGSIPLIKKLKDIIKEITNIDFGYKERKFVNTIAVTYIKGNDKVLKFLNWLYSDPQFVLPRKYNKYQEIKKIKEIIISNKSSKYRGVYYRRNAPHASIEKNNKRYYLGRFLTERDAAEAYNAKAIELFGPNTKLNIF
jgi:hypothetical protein